MCRSIDRVMRMAERLKLCEDVRLLLEDFVKCAREELLSKPMRCIMYPCGSSPNCWNHKKIDELNKQAFRELNGMGNVYCIFTKSEGDDWIVQYIGKSKRCDLRQRIRSHLVYKSENTGSQLEKIQCAVGKRDQVSISYILIEPEALRSYVEESILSAKEDCQFLWNKNSA